MAVKSPCTDVCIFDNPKGWCQGCGRTLNETREWRKLSPYHRKAIERALPGRLEILTTGPEKGK
ncbi:Fe-S protein (plasmid) [Erwinia rhapontici]